MNQAPAAKVTDQARSPASDCDGPGRGDFSSCLIHFTKSNDTGSAYEVLCEIVRQRRLIGAKNCIRGGTPCVCFSEAPTTSLSHGLVNAYGDGRYSLFGVRFTKEWIFSLGGRPVIYQPECEYQFLKSEIRWRHMRFEIDCLDRIDFTSEREWRLPLEELTFSPADVQLVFPNAGWAARFSKDFSYLSYLEHGESGYYEESPWKTIDLGCRLIGQQPPKHSKVGC